LIHRYYEQAVRRTGNEKLGKRRRQAETSQHPPIEKREERKKLGRDFWGKEE